MNKRTALARWTSLLAVLTLVLAACTFPQIPSTTTATPIHVSIPALDANAIAKILHSKIPAIATVPFPKFIKTPLGPHIPSTNDISDFTFYWQGSPVPYPVNQLTLFSPNCSQPMNVNSFSVAVTTNKATTFQHGWIAMTFANNVQTNYAVGPGTTSTFNSASTHSFAQDIPFSLNCGTYQIGLWVNFGTTGGYLLESLVIEGTATTTPVATSSASLGDMSGFTFFWQGSPVPYPSNQLTLYSLDCSQPLTVRLLLNRRHDQQGDQLPARLYRHDVHQQRPDDLCPWPGHHQHLPFRLHPDLRPGHPLLAEMRDLQHRPVGELRHHGRLPAGKPGDRGDRHPDAVATTPAATPIISCA